MRGVYRVGLLAGRVNAYERRLCEGVASFAQTQGDWELAFIRPEDLSRKAVSADIDGFICRVPDRLTATALIRTGKPVVDVLNEVPCEAFSHVDSDHAAVGVRAAEHFLGRRFVNFAFCGSGQSFLDARRDAFFQRIVAEKSAYRTFDYKDLPGEARAVTVGVDGTPGKVPDARRLEKWVSTLPKPVAVFCSHDLRAYQLLQVCKRAGVAVPDEVAILGVGNDTLVCSFTQPSISSVDLNAEGVGRLAAALLADRMYGAKTKDPTQPRVVPPRELVVRPSTEVYPVEPRWLSDALVFIRKNVSKGIIAADVIAYLERSHTVVESAFRKVLKTTVQKEIMRTRMDAAVRLLTLTDLPVSEVCRRSGFTRAQYFCNAFQQTYRCSPTEYRTRHKQT